MLLKISTAKGVTELHVFVADDVMLCFSTILWAHTNLKRYRNPSFCEYQLKRAPTRNFQGNEYFKETSKEIKISSLDIFDPLSKWCGYRNQLFHCFFSLPTSNRVKT